MTVYFAQGSESGLVKIGFSQRTWSRVEQISSSGSDKMVLLRVCTGGRVAEQWVHKQFADLRCHGEWFKFSPEMMSIEIPPEFQSDSDVTDKVAPIEYAIDVEGSLRGAMKEAYAHLRGADKAVAADANVLQRTARNWLAEVNMPSASALIYLLSANDVFRASVYSLVDELSAHRAERRKAATK